MDVVAAICYVASCLCFLGAVTKMQIAPASLDLVAMGLFFLTFPTLLSHLAPFF